MTSKHFTRSGLIAFAILALIMLAPTVNADSRAVPLMDGFITGCTGEYFNNTTLSGSPVMVRADPTLNFFWPENTSPGAGVAVNNYSVRWTCTVNAPSSGNYTFSIVTDDGMNVLVDNNLILWAWYDQGPTAYSGTIYLNAGTHSVRVEYYNRNLGGTAQVSSSLGSGGTTTGDWIGEYYNNDSLSGSPTITRHDGSINFDWGTGTPDPAIPVDHFSVRWTRTVYLNAATWRFTTTTDDGVRLWVDNILLIDKWFPQPATAYSADMVLATGNHTIRMEYYENVMNAVARLSYAPVNAPPPPPQPTAVPPPPPGPGGVWLGQYFNNMSFSGAPVYTRNDPAINFNWGETISPAPGMPHDFISIRWDSTQYAPTTGNYTITAVSDDGVRVWVDGIVVIDGWSDHPPIWYSATVYLTAGAHAFHVEYYNRQLGAMIGVQISGITPPPPPPASQVIVDDRGPGWQAGGRARWYEAGIGIGNHAFWTYSNPYIGYGYNWARWYPTLPAPGYYEVAAYIPDNLGTTLYARYWVYHGGRYDLAVRPQGFHHNQWLVLGTYYFTAQGGEFVSLADVTYECYYCRTVTFDAVKFSPR